MELTQNKDQNMPISNPNLITNKWQRFEFALNIFNHVLIGFVAIYLSWMCLTLGLDKVYAQHVGLCTIGFNLLMAEALMTHYNGNALLFFYTRKTKTTIHWILQALGGSLGIAGGLAIVYRKQVHFTTFHGKVGLASMIICAVAMVTGLSALYSQSLKKFLQPLLNKSLHNFLGIAGFVLAMIAQFTGYEYERVFSTVTEATFEVMLKVITVVIVTLCCYGPFKEFLVKCKNIYENF